MPSYRGGTGALLADGYASAVTEVVMVNRREADPDWRSGHDQRADSARCTVALALSGAAHYSGRDGDYRVGPGDLLWFPWGRGHTGRSDRRRPWTFLSATVVLATDAATRARFDALPERLAVGARSRCRSLLEDALDAWTAADPGHLLRCQAALSALVAEIVRLGGTVGGDPLLAATAALVRELAERPTTTVPVATLARRLGVGPTRLRELFRAVTGQPPTRYQNLLRIRHARDLIATGSDVGSAAAAAGFADRHYFARLCRRLTGETPSSWKR